MSNKLVYRSELSVYDGVQLLRIWDLYDTTPTVTNGTSVSVVLLKADRK